MKKTNVTGITNIAKKSKKVLTKAPQLEAFQERIYGEYRHFYYRFLYHLVADLKPMLSLEIGVDQGLGSIHMSVAAEKHKGHVIGVDVSEANLVPGVIDYPNYIFLHKNSLVVEEDLRVLTAKYGKIGLVFQDSSHHYEASQKEWNVVSPFLHKNAIWICDDIHKIDSPNKEMSDYFEWLPGRKKIYDFLHEGTKVGVILL